MQTQWKSECRFGVARSLKVGPSLLLGGSRDRIQAKQVIAWGKPLKYQAPKNRNLPGSYSLISFWHVEGSCEQDQGVTKPLQNMTGSQMLVQKLTASLSSAHMTHMWKKSRKKFLTDAFVCFRLLRMALNTHHEFARRILVFIPGATALRFLPRKGLR